MIRDTGRRPLDLAALQVLICLIRFGFRDVLAECSLRFSVSKVVVRRELALAPPGS